MADLLPLGVTSAQWATIEDILATGLTGLPGTQVCVFGSRSPSFTAQRVKPYSDLDLLVVAPTPVPGAVLAQLREAFCESALPWKVDLVDQAHTSAQFLALIAPQRCPVYAI